MWELLNDEVVILFVSGLGYSMIIVSSLISFYYNIIIAVCMYYFFLSMTSTLPWVTCDPEWASCNCRDSTMNVTDPNPWNYSRPECCSYLCLFNYKCIQHVLKFICKASYKSHQLFVRMM